jgi:hypothetical protein
MPRRKTSVYAVLAVIVLGALVLQGHRVVQRRSQTICEVCQRVIKPEAGVLADIGGRQRRVCCARCAITEAQQEHQTLRLLAVTDYPSQKKLDPEKAWYVEGSRLVACDHDAPPLDSSKRAQQVAFDRCSPGAFAFELRADADALVARYGGVVRRHSELMAEVPSR